jgi:glutamate racemase
MLFFMAKIGFFDSGVGGLTVWAEVLKALPEVSTIYLADSANSPYGNKSLEEVITLCKKNTEWLIRQGCQLIVVACNTATTQAIAELRATYSVPFVGVEPATKPAAFASKTRHIAVLATAGTLESELFQKTKDAFANDVQVDVRVGKGLVAAIEKGAIDTPAFADLLQAHLLAVVSPTVDYLVLGCTHYPLFKSQIAQLINTPLTVIDSGQAVANRVSELWAVQPEEATQNVSHNLVTTGSQEVLKSIAQRVAPHYADTIIYSSLYQSE